MDQRQHEEIEHARRQLKKRAYDKGHKTRAATLLACEWLTVLTTVAPTELNPEINLRLYRVRWQIELYIKRLKTILGVGRLRARRGSQLARVHLLAQMLYVLLLESLAVERLGKEWIQMSGNRRGTWWRVWQLLRDEWTTAILGTADWSVGEWRLALKALWERKRRRKLQRLTKPMLGWLREIAPIKLLKRCNPPSVMHLAA